MVSDPLTPLILNGAAPSKALILNYLIGIIINLYKI